MVANKNEKPSDGATEGSSWSENELPATTYLGPPPEGGPVGKAEVETVADHLREPKSGTGLRLAQGRRRGMGRSWRVQ